MDLTPLAKDDPIDQAEFTGSIIRRFASAHRFFPNSQFSLVSLGQS
jgi:hypothetical protein